MNIRLSAAAVLVAIASLPLSVSAQSADLKGYYRYPAIGSDRIVFTEGEEDFVKISFRSKGDYDVCSVAKDFNGGGHKNASGAMIRGGMRKVKDDVMNRLISLLKT